MGSNLLLYSEQFVGLSIRYEMGSGSKMKQTMVGEWSGERSLIVLPWIYLVLIFLVILKFIRFGVLYPFVGQ